MTLSKKREDKESGGGLIREAEIGLESMKWWVLEEKEMLLKLLMVRSSTTIIYSHDWQTKEATAGYIIIHVQLWQRLIIEN
jgi:hypothetical protein